MSQSLPIVYDANIIPALPETLMNELREAKKYDFAGFGGGFRSIKVRKMDFLLKDGGAQEVVPPQQLYGVFLASVPYNHCVWYEKSYQPGQEPEQPDLLWKQRDDGSQFPDALPAQFREKMMINGQMRWAYQVRRRTVWALIKAGADGNMYLDLENPYVFDISSMSIFGKGQPDQNIYKWSGIYNLCQQQSSNEFVCTPSMFVTQILIDPTVQVSGVVCFRPARNPQTRTIQFLEGSLIEQILQTRHQDSVQAMLDFKEILDYNPGNSGLQQAWEQPMPTAQPQPQPQPVQPPVQVVPASVPTQPVAPVQVMPEPTPVQPQPMQPSAAPDASANLSSLLAQAQAQLASPIAQPSAVPIPPQAAAQTAGPAASSADIDALLGSL